MHQLLIKYLENRCSAEEIDKVLAYIKSDKGQRHLAKIMEEDFHDSYVAVSNQEKDEESDDQLYNRIKSSLGMEEAQVANKRLTPNSSWYAVAAVVSGLIFLATLALLFVPQSSPVLYETAFGETKSIHLPDGSRVTLNANSSLKLTDDFNDDRQLWLKGEAFFEVQEVREKDGTDFIKFTVHTDRLDVEVLGTSFNVQDYQQKTQVVLESGKVRLKSANQQEMTMLPGELAEITEGKSRIKKIEVNPELYTSWKENKLYCDDTPLSEIADLISFRFGKEVVFQQDDLGDINITGTLPLQDLSLLSKILQETLKIKIQAYETKIVISKNEKPAQKSNRQKGTEQVESTP